MKITLQEQKRVDKACDIVNFAVTLVNVQIDDFEAKLAKLKFDKVSLVAIVEKA